MVRRSGNRQVEIVKRLDTTDWYYDAKYGERCLDIWLLPQGRALAQVQGWSLRCVAAASIEILGYALEMMLRSLTTTLVLFCACAHGSSSVGSTEPVGSKESVDSEVSTAETSGKTPRSTTSLGEARPDQVFGVTAQTDQAIAPFVMDALNSYPQARERFLAGLPAEQRLLVVSRIPRADGTFEQVFVHCQSIEDGVIKGLLASEVKIDGLGIGSSLSVNEADLLDWVIVLADGREEGNRVGRFLDYWKLRKFFGVLFAIQRTENQVSVRYLHVLDGTPNGKLNFDPPSIFLEAAITELSNRPFSDIPEGKEAYTYVLYWPLEPTNLDKKPDA